MPLVAARPSFTKPGRIAGWLAPACALLASLVVCIYQIGGTAFDIRVPLSGSGDMLLHMLMAKRLIVGDGFYADGALGFPYGSTLYDFPGSDSLSMLFLLAAGKLGGSAVVAVNAYYLAGFPLATWAFVFVARRMGAGLGPALAGGLLFAWLPFHFLRLAHLYYTWYFVAPLYVWYGWKIYSGEGRATAGLRGRVMDALAIALLACAGVYFAVFGMIVFLMAGALATAEKRGSKLWLAVGACAVVCASVLANTAPTIVHRIEHGKNREVAQRSPAEADVYGLKIAQLVLPQPVHRNEKLQRLNAKYSTAFPLVNENSSSALGIVASLGFLGLLGYAILGRGNTGAARPLRYASVVVLGLVLIATIGGFGSLFAIFVSPLIRGWNRVSVFIAALSLLGVALALTGKFDQWRGRSWGAAATGLVLALVVGIGFVDQVGLRCGSACAAGLQAQYAASGTFFSALQQAVPRGAAIYVLPYMPFPEPPPKARLEPYALAEGYLMTDGLRWSWGAMKGRDAGDSVYKALEGKPVAEQVDAVRATGFAGVLVDRRGYADSGRAIEAQLLATGHARLVAAQDTRAFYRFTP